MYFDGVFVRDDDGEGHEKDNVPLAAIVKLITQPIHKARRLIEPTDNILVLIFVNKCDSIVVVVAVELKNL